MSRGFVKEDDQEEAPFIPPRAALPRGVVNYVTPNGYRLLLEEKEQLEVQIANNNLENEKEKRLLRAVLTGKLNLLTQRISTARLIELKDQPQDEVRFGAVVTFCKAGKDKSDRTFQLVGVDEANLKEQKIAFIAPIAKALTGKRKGDEAQVKIGQENMQLKILKINYPEILHF